jgi:hypothetical protein
MSVSFLSPHAALVGLVLLVPLTALVLRDRRDGRVRKTLGLAAPGRRSHVVVVGAWVVVFGLLAAAAAQPVVRIESTVATRTDAQAFFVFDITRSMLASRGVDSPQRIDRAIETALDVRRGLADLPVGVGSLTNRPLPQLFPTADQDAFQLVVRRSIGVNRPPGTKRGLFGLSTDFTALEAFATDNYFTPDAVRRLVVLFTDGESRAFAPRDLVQKLQKGGVDLIVVRFWNRDERIWQANGRPEPEYRPSSFTLPAVDDLAALTTGGRVFQEDETAAIVAAAQGYVGRGPTVPVAAPGHTVSLAPYAVLAACIPLAFLLLAGILPARWRRTRRYYVGSADVMNPSRPASPSAARAPRLPTSAPPT